MLLGDQLHLTDLSVYAQDGSQPSVGHPLRGEVLGTKGSVRHSHAEQRHQ